MQCEICSTQNPDTRKFCRECGSALLIVCPRCRLSNHPQDKFCGECGQPLSPAAAKHVIDYAEPRSYTPKHLTDKILITRSALEGERKLVTILFADVADYTAMSEQMDPEQIHQMMDECFKILMDAVHKYEGTINQFTGDGIMAIFGAPLAIENHAQCACHAALAIEKAMLRFGEKIQRDFGVAFRMRIGINSGHVIVGAVGDDLRMDYTAIGDTTNLAARMEHHAQPGTILLSDNTFRIVQPYFECEPLGRIDVKGKAEPQAVVRLVRAGDIDSRFDASVAKGLTRFVGRKKSLPALAEPYRLAMSGSGQVVGLVGEAGVGKCGR